MELQHELPVQWILLTLSVCIVESIEQSHRVYILGLLRVMCIGPISQTCLKFITNSSIVSSHAWLCDWLGEQDCKIDRQRRCWESYKEGEKERRRVEISSTCSMLNQLQLSMDNSLNSSNKIYIYISVKLAETTKFQVKPMFNWFRIVLTGMQIENMICS